jgi:hypothetical protein
VTSVKMAVSWDVCPVVWNLWLNFVRVLKINYGKCISTNKCAVLLAFTSVA